MDQTSRPEPPPEAELITAARKRRRLSIRQAASIAGISDARWRQIASGYQTVSGTRLPVRAPADTLARMARAVGVSAQGLTEAGREDAADELGPQSAESGLTPDDDYATDPHIDAIASLLETLPPEAQDAVFRKVGRGGCAGQGDDGHAAPQRRTG